jgi:hypothetical protein
MISYVFGKICKRVLFLSIECLDNIGTKVLFHVQITNKDIIIRQ